VRFVLASAAVVVLLALVVPPLCSWLRARAVAAEHYPAALRWAQAAALLRPTSYNRQRVAELLWNVGEQYEAGKRLAGMFEAGHDLSDVGYFMALDYLGRHGPAASETRAAEAATARHPNSPWAWLAAGKYSMRRFDYAETADRLFQAMLLVERKPGYMSQSERQHLYTDLSVAYAAIGEYQSAAGTAFQAVELAPDGLLTQALRALCIEVMGDYAIATDYWKTCVRIKSQEWNPVYLAILCLARQGRVREGRLLLQNEQPPLHPWDALLCEAALYCWQSRDHTLAVLRKLDVMSLTPAGRAMLPVLLAGAKSWDGPSAEAARELGKLQSAVPYAEAYRILYKIQSANKTSASDKAALEACLRELQPFHAFIVRLDAQQVLAGERLRMPRLIEIVVGEW